MKKKYDLLANESGLLYKAKIKIIPYIMVCDCIITKYHRNYLKELNITPTIEAYIQSTVLKKTLETILLEYRRSIEDGIDVKDRIIEANLERQVPLEANRRPSKRKIKNNITLTF
ncbi:hypothetical protein TCON_1203 [Astathelohania contejeani]|uniref:Uncharacterized protein n=1 Tax=Astathelohania contejeani TaxID=164912 RepID=A0ABQ7HZN4_9MICR|nr:hypothetical protein TCON_1203 [Thelohania contejeani]